MPCGLVNELKRGEVVGFCNVAAGLNAAVAPLNPGSMVTVNERCDRATSQYAYGQYRILRSSAPIGDTALLSLPKRMAVMNCTPLIEVIKVVI